MKVIHIEQNSLEWLNFRKGKITGSKLGDIVVKRGNGKKIGFYQLVADRLSLDTESENAMERGHELEQQARDRFAELTGKQIITESVMLVSDENPNIAISPDGLIEGNDNKFTEAIEIKCLSGARHLEAYFENKIPSEYREQVVQYFVVNEDLEKLYFVFFDPRIVAKDLFWIEVTRNEVQDEIDYLKDYQLQTLKEVDELVEKLIQF